MYEVALTLTLTLALIPHQGGLFCLACLVQNAYLGMTEWRQVRVRVRVRGRSRGRGRGRRLA